MELNEAVSQAEGRKAEVQRLDQEVRARLQELLQNIEDHFSHGRTDQAR
jgi:hypothetical protein